MQRIGAIVFFWVLGLISSEAYSQTLPPNVCVIENGKLVFTIDLNWGPEQKLELRQAFDLDSVMLAELFKGARVFTVDGERWEAMPVAPNVVRLFKPVQKRPLLERFFQRLAHRHYSPPPPPPVFAPVREHFGFNQLRGEAVSFKNDSLCRFFLKGFQDANQVVLSGSFNYWNTSHLSMVKTPEGWQLEIPLSTGKHLYKYIVDGKWMEDPDNLQREPDGVGGWNSVVYRTNFTFRLSEYADAQQVMLAGSFNHWNSKEAPMHKTPEGWEMQVYLMEGRHLYKFIVDGNWIHDPGNPKKVSNEFDTWNSVLEVGERIPFVLRGFSEAKRVFLAGSFNEWSPAANPLQKTDSGWVAYEFLPAGNYEYKFVVDGRWMVDPDNPQRLGSGDFENSLFVYKPNYTFVLNHFPVARTVIVTGSFNGWLHHGYVMQRRNDRWELDVYLPKGKITYRFIVDGQWMHDPDNPAYEPNRFKSFDSVLWKE